VNQFLWCCLAVLQMGCVVGQMMTTETFSEIQIGMSLGEVEALAGKPWEVKPLPRNGTEAVYCERVRLDGVCRQETRYVLVFQDGRLVSKRSSMVGPGQAGGSKRF
jgi:hypothetical protein